MPDQQDVIFSVEQVKALCGGKLPFQNQKVFAWERVEHFRLKDNRLKPYAKNEVVEYVPDISVETNLVY